MYDEYMTFYNSFTEMEHYIPLLIVITIVLNAMLRVTITRANHKRYEQIRKMRILDTRLRQAKKELREERMKWNCDYRIMCERARK